MANRVIRDWTASESVDELSPKAEVFFTRLIMKADDYGNYTGNPRLIASALFPLKMYDIQSVVQWMEECEKQGLIVLYTNGGKKYIHIPNFGQTLRRMKAVYPAPNIDGSLRTSVRQVSDNVGQMTAETKGKETEVETETKQEREGEMLTLLGLEISVKKLLEDEVWKHNIHSVARGKDLEGAARASFVFLTTKPERFKTADLNELKKVTLSWLENKPHNSINGQYKVDQKERMKNL